MNARWLGIVFVAALAAVPAAAQGTCQAEGKIADEQGAPLEGVRVVFSAESNPALMYEGKTNKKGRYFVPGMFTGKEGDRWKIEVEAEGLVPLEMTVASRTASRTLIADPQTVKIKPHQNLPPIVIRPLGSATVDFVLATPERVAAMRAAPAAPAAVEARPQAQQMTPWDEALTKAQAMDYEGAIPLFEKAIEDKPDDPERRRAFAQVLYKVERFDDAVVQANRAIELEPDRVVNLLVLYSAQVNQEDFAAAKATLDRAGALEPNNVDVLKQKAFLAVRAGQPADQIQAYKDIVAVAPEDVEAWMSLGDLYAAQGDLVQSEAAYQRVVALDPTNAHQSFFNLGALLMNKEDRTEADARKAAGAFRKATELAPKYAPAWRELGFALLNVGERAEARKALDEYLRLAPNAPDAARVKKVVGALPKAAA